MTAMLKIRGISKNFKAVNGIVSNALCDFSLTINKGELLAIVGPSGSGKTTLLNMIAGIENPDSGKVESSSTASPLRIGYVFQSNAIFPWRTVERNLTYPLEIDHSSSAARKQKASEICQLVGLDPKLFLSKYPKELSGGESRRVAIGMTLARDPHLLLLDEPTSQLDYETKWSIQNTIQRLWLEKRFTVILVTHDLEEAVYLGDRVLVLRGGTSVNDVQISLARPRTDHIRTTKEFGDYRERIVAANTPTMK
jgi:ABC-type nitrate/sulfonate/bicarbonate transport system ATPase subunit